MNHRGEGGIQGRMLLPDRARLEKQSFLLLVAGIGVNVTPGLPEGLGFAGQGAGPLRLRHGDSVSCGLGLVVTWGPRVRCLGLVVTCWKAKDPVHIGKHTCSTTKGQGGVLGLG